MTFKEHSSIHVCTSSCVGYCISLPYVVFTITVPTFPHCCTYYMNSIFSKNKMVTCFITGQFTWLFQFGAQLVFYCFLYTVVVFGCDSNFIPSHCRHMSEFADKCISTPCTHHIKTKSHMLSQHSMPSSSLSLSEIATSNWASALHRTKSN